MRRGSIVNLSRPDLDEEVVREDPPLFEFPDLRTVVFEVWFYSTTFSRWVCMRMLPSRALEERGVVVLLPTDDVYAVRARLLASIGTPH